MKLKAAFLAILLAHSLPAAAQSSGKKAFDEYLRAKREEFNKYRQEKKTEFEQYKRKLNEEYAEKISSAWKAYKQKPGKKLPPRPEPPSPVKVGEDTPSSPRTVPIGKVTPAEAPLPDVPVTLPLPDSGKGKRYKVNFKFFNTPCGIDKFDTALLSLPSIDSNTLGKAWRKLTANGRLEPLVGDCLRLRETLALCDWGYLLLVGEVAAVLYPGDKNCQAFLATAILNQSGYDCRLAAVRGCLVTMFHAAHTIYALPYYVIDSKKYQILGPLAHDASGLTTYPGDFYKKSIPVRMTVDRYPKLLPDPSKTHVYSSESWKDAPGFEIRVNTSVMDFFSKYPQVDWTLYGMAPMSDELKTKLIEVMRTLVAGLGEVDAVNLLLRYMQGGFKYKTDGEQFGKEKPFFFDENFYYPFNDCEDRAILFAHLVRTVLGLDAVYLHYPNHLAAAVRFSPGVEVGGHVVSVDGDKYVVCEPTASGYVKAGAMGLEYTSLRPEVYRLR